MTRDIRPPHIRPFPIKQIPCPFYRFPLLENQILSKTCLNNDRVNIKKTKRCHGAPHQLFSPCLLCNSILIICLDFDHPPLQLFQPLIRIGSASVLMLRFRYVPGVVRVTWN